MCPECESFDIEAIDEDSREMEVKMICLDCGHTWWTERTEAGD